MREAFSGTAGVSIEVLDEAAMRKLGMGTLVGVGQGSPRGSRLMLVRYRGANAAAAPMAFVGKGITFDSGGISLKPGAGMWDMKGDMSGAASVMGAVLSLAKSRASAHVVGVAALAENMPDGNAQRPGDVTRTMSGKTIEMLNSDAEGRLVLADANEYVAQAYKPRAIVNIATLTGAIVGALDDQYAGLFARDETLAANLLAAGKSQRRGIVADAAPQKLRRKDQVGHRRHPQHRARVKGRAPASARMSSAISSTKRRRGRISTSPG